MLCLHRRRMHATRVDQYTIDTMQSTRKQQVRASLSACMRPPQKPCNVYSAAVRSIRVFTSIMQCAAQLDCTSTHCELRLPTTFKRQQANHIDYALIKKPNIRVETFSISVSRFTPMSKCAYVKLKSKFHFKVMHMTWPGMCSMFKTKAKATTFCPRAVLEVEDSPRGPHPWTWHHRKFEPELRYYITSCCICLSALTFSIISIILMCCLLSTLRMRTIHHILQFSVYWSTWLKFLHYRQGEVGGLHEMMSKKIVSSTRSTQKERSAITWKMWKYDDDTQVLYRTQLARSAAICFFDIRHISKSKKTLQPE